MPRDRAHFEPSHPIEITVTHRPPLTDEMVRRFFDDKVIMIGTAGYGADRAAYPPNLVNDFDCMEWLRQRGGAVIANYPGCLRTGERVIGRAVPAKDFLRVRTHRCLEPLFGLRLDPWSIVKTCTLRPTADLRPHSRAIATCHKRTEGRLAAAVERLK